VDNGVEVSICFEAWVPDSERRTVMQMVSNDMLLYHGHISERSVYTRAVLFLRKKTGFSNVRKRRTTGPFDVLKRN